MNLRYQTHAEAAEEIREALEDSEGWLTLQEVAELVGIDVDEDFEALNDLRMMLNLMARFGKVKRLSGGLGAPLYRV